VARTYKVAESTGEGKTEKIQGTYKLDGNKLSLKLKRGDDDKSVEVTITKLTDEVLEGEADGKKETFRRVKDKK
jgi:uncharacterized protein (TIGR03066 family)